MCAKPEPAEVFRPLAGLAASLDTPWQFGWVGIQAFYGFLENV